MDDLELFALLDELARGLAREAALSESERAAKADQILTWFRPRYEKLLLAARERPCPTVLHIDVTTGTITPSIESPHPCHDCLNSQYDAWKTARKRASILAGSA